MNRTTRRAAPDRSGSAFRIAIVGALLLALAFAGPAAAQMTRGAISGTVRDATGAIVPGATVTVTSADTNQARTAVTDAQGFYRVAALEPGRYTVRTELAGFSTVEKRDVPVRTAQRGPRSTSSPEGRRARRKTITVTAEPDAVELNKTDATIGLTSTARQAVELPLSAGRDINNLVLLTPNTVNVTAANGGNTNIGQGSYVINGQRSRNNNYMIDGSDNNDISVTIATSQIVPEAVAGVPGADQRLQRRVRPQQRRADQPDHQVRHQQLPRRGLGVLHAPASSTRSPTSRRTPASTSPPSYHRHQFGARHRRADHQGQAVLLRPLPARHAAAGARDRA